MKRILISLALSFALIMPAMAQEEKVTVPKSVLTKDQLEQISSQQLRDKVESYGKWVGIGHELGTAINESLTAVSSQANNFAQTPVGKLTAALVIWKVVGHDLLGFIVGAVIVILIFPIWLWSYARFLPREIIDAETYDKDTGKLVSRTYKRVNNPDNDEVSGFIIAHYFMLAILFAVASITMWA